MQDLQAKEEPQSNEPGGQTSLRAMHTALAVALELLDELVEGMPDKPDASALKEIDDVLREIRDLAAAGQRAIAPALRQRASRTSLET